MCWGGEGGYENDMNAQKSRVGQIRGYNKKNAQKQYQIKCKVSKIK